MKIAVAAVKGGVGKTTSTFCLAAVLSRMGKRVLCIDLDSQADLSAAFRCECDASNPNIGEVLNSSRREQRSLMKKAVVSIEGWADLITPGSQLDHYEKEVEKGIGSDQRLRDALDAISSEYDFILLDTPKGDGLLTRNALVACDQVVVPVQMEWLAVKNLPRLLQKISEIADRLNPDVVVSTFVPFQLRRTSFSKRSYQDLCNWDATPHLPFQQAPIWVAPPVNDLTLYAELSEAGVPIYEYPGVEDKHIEPFQKLADYLEQQRCASLEVSHAR
ncbi:ParA family protein [Phormidesmis priestleyi]